MKRFIYVLLIFTFLMVGCRKTNDVDCLANWNKLNICGQSEYTNCINISDLGAAMQILNEKYLPNTVGEYAQKCLLEGYRPPGMGK